MLSPLATTNVAAPFAPAQGERELKFTLSEGRVDLVRRRLERTCRRDAEFPEAIVWTIYYDTPALVSLGEKITAITERKSACDVLGIRGRGTAPRSSKQSFGRYRRPSLRTLYPAEAGALGFTRCAPARVPGVMISRNTFKARGSRHGFAIAAIASSNRERLARRPRSNRALPSSPVMSVMTTPIACCARTRLEAKHFRSHCARSCSSDCTSGRFQNPGVIRT